MSYATARRNHLVEVISVTPPVVIGQAVRQLSSEITRPEDNDQIVAATYRRYLPTDAELAAELERERAEAKRVLRLTAPSADGGGEP